jgi:plastocyanin
MHRSIRRGAAAIAALLALALPGCGGSGGGGPTDPGGNNNEGQNGNGGATSNITVTWSSFSPGAATVASGGTVIWTWASCNDGEYGGGGCATHNVTFDNGSAGSASQNQGTYSRRFTTAGTYGYHCTLHGSPTSGMRGTITVQ